MNGLTIEMLMAEAVGDHSYMYFIAKQTVCKEIC